MMSESMQVHFVATTYVFNEQFTKTALVYNKKINSWLPPGGHLNEGELPHQGALREALEETGLAAEIVDVSYFDYADDRTTSQPIPYTIFLESISGPKCKEHLDFIYVAKSRELPLKNSCESHDAKWVVESELESINPMLENARLLAKNLFKKFSGKTYSKTLK